MSINTVHLLGRLGSDPEMSYTQTGSPVCKISLATNKTWKTKGGTKKEKVSWHRLVVWGSLSEIAGEYLKKGQQAYFEGEIDYKSWDGKDGEKKYMTEIIVTKIDLLEDKQQG